MLIDLKTEFVTYYCMLISPTTLASGVARACKAKRQALALRQSDLAARSHVAETTIVRFERTGSISLRAAARILVALNLAAPILDALTSASLPPPARTGDEFLRGAKVRQRIRVSHRKQNQWG
jgi:transcriptional regulator with XRE-family HTH domain